MDISGSLVFEKSESREVESLPGGIDEVVEEETISEPLLALIPCEENNLLKAWLVFPNCIIFYVKIEKVVINR